MKLANKTIVVTGASGGMGKETVKELLSEGARVVALDLTIDSLQTRSESFFPLSCNLTSEEEVIAAFTQIQEVFGSIHGLVNLVGIAQQATPLEEVSYEKWNQLMSVNISSVFLTCREAIKYMKKGGGGSIVNVASISVVRPRPGLQAYIASKGAVVSFSQALAIEVASNNIRVNVIHPGPCDTEMLQQFAAKGANQEEIKENIFKQSVPLGQLVKPKDIAKAVLFLCSKDASMMTGTVMNVDGGRGI